MCLQHLTGLEKVLQACQLLVETEDDAIFVRNVLHKLSLSLKLFLLDLDPSFSLLLIFVFKLGNLFTSRKFQISKMHLQSPSIASKV